MFDSVTLWKYGTVLATLLIAGFGAPIPEELPIVGAGALVGHDAQELAYHDEIAGSVGGGPVAYLESQKTPPHLTRWWIMLPVCMFGVVAGDCSIYWIGRLWGTKLLASAWVQRRLLPPEQRQKIEENFHKNGILILLGARLTPGIRTPVFMMAGVLQMKFRRFLLADCLYAIPGVNLLFWLSYWFTDQFKSAVESVDKHRPIAIAIVLALAGAVILYKVLKNRTKIATGDPSEIPGYAKPVGVVTHAVEQTIEKTAAVTAAAAMVVVDKVTHPLGHHPTVKTSETPVLPPKAPTSPPEVG